MMGSKSKQNKMIIFRSKDNENIAETVILDASDNSQTRFARQSNLKSSLRRVCSPSNTRRNSVKFDSVDIREHERFLDLNPSVSSGPAIGLGWEYNDLPTFKLNTFERNHPPRRTKIEFQIPRHIREEMLREFGFSRGELAAAVKAINISKRQRQASVASQEVECTRLAFEWTVRKLKKIIRLRSSYQIEEARLWKNAENLSKNKST
mmetsp:Transcript_25983/g.29728  ORF Transcript_25983/g.29728 Transcript_25983/m.29728 type:complete len:207 (+) Transcript_25983:90-710(+)